MNERLTDNEFHSKDNKERACYIQEPRLQAIYDKCFEYEDIDTNPTRLANIKKALEIIKEKKVFVANLIYHFENDDNVINYNRSCGWAKSELSLQEYELLKEVLYEKETS